MPFPVGTVIEVVQLGAGPTTLVAGPGVTIRSTGGRLGLADRYASASLRQRAADEWIATGDLVAVSAEPEPDPKPEPEPDREPEPEPDREPRPKDRFDTADMVLWWSASAMSHMDAETLAYWRSHGVDGWVIASFGGYSAFLDGLGGNQRFTGDPAAIGPGPEWAAQREMRDNIAPRVATAGQVWLLLVDSKNRSSVSGSPLTWTITGPARTPAQDADWTNVGIPRIREAAAMVRLYGGKGVMLDHENYPSAIDGSRDYTFGGGQGLPSRTRWMDYGEQLGVALGRDWPDIHIGSYFTLFPGAFDMFQRYPDDYPPLGSTENSTANNVWVFLRGLTQGLHRAAPDGNWHVVLNEAAYYRGAMGRGSRQMDLNGVTAFCSRTWPHWHQVHDRLGVEPMLWIDRGVVSDPMTQSELAVTKDYWSDRHLDYRNYHMVVVGDHRIRQCFVYDRDSDWLPNRQLDMAPDTWPDDYQPFHTAASSSAALPAHPAPTLTIAAPADGVRVAGPTLEVRGTATPDPDHGVSAVLWSNRTTGESGHVPLDWVREGGSVAEGWVHHMSVTTSPVGPPVLTNPGPAIAGPSLAMGPNVVVFTARDTGGLTSAPVTRTVTRTA